MSRETVSVFQAQSSHCLARRTFSSKDFRALLRGESSPGRPAGAARCVSLFLEDVMQLQRK